MSKTTELLKTAFWALNILPNQEIDAYKAEVGNIKDTYHLANLIEEHLKELNKQPPADNPEAIDNLAQIIRQVDGNHDKGAAELAEAILNKMGQSKVEAYHSDYASAILYPDRLGTVCEQLLSFMEKDIKNAIKKFGEYNYSDKGPKEVCKMAYHQLRSLPVEDAVATLQALYNTSEEAKDYVRASICSLDDWGALFDENAPWADFISENY